MVNRIWQTHFGRGIVGSSSDFGVMGDRPTHPELLDWLSATFVEQGWSVKRLHKQIVMTAAYRQASTFDAETSKKDPDNLLLWRFRRHRLEGEAVRDAALQVSGLLQTKMGGPGVFAPRADVEGSRGSWSTTKIAAEANRRSIYLFVRRNSRYPMFESFDMPDTHENCSRRQQTVNVTQSLALLNDAMVLDWARAMADRVLNDAGMSRESQIQRAFRIAYGRMPSGGGATVGGEFLRTAGGPDGESGRGCEVCAGGFVPCADEFE
jgi:hypothetical protein